MRTTLYEAAQIVVAHSTKWSWLKAWAMKVARHRGLKRAIVAFARWLAVIMHRIWVEISLMTPRSLVAPRNLAVQTLLMAANNSSLPLGLRPEAPQPAHRLAG